MEGESSFVAVISSCLSYCLFSAMMTITNKELLGSSKHEGYFAFPTTLVFYQNFTSFLFLRLAAVLGLLSLEPIQPSRLKQWIPLNLCFLAMLTTGSFALSLLTVPMVTIFKNLQTAIISFGDWYFLGKSSSLGTIACLIVMITGAVTAGYNDLEFDLRGYFWVLFNCLCGAAYVLFTKLVIDTQKMNKINNINYNCTISLPFLFAVMIVNGELSGVMRWFLNIPWSAYFVVLVVSNAVFSFGISFTSFWVLQTTSPTTFSILGAVNKVPLTLFSIWWFNNVFSTVGGYAVSGSLIGGIIYAVNSAYQQAQERKQRDIV